VTDWDALTQRTLAGLASCAPIYRPTTFWGSAVQRLMDDLEADGLASFKSWSAAGIWFYPLYGPGFTKDAVARTFEHASAINPSAQLPWFTNALNGALQARRDFDAARLAWDQSRWPFDLEGLGESEIGKPPQAYRLVPSKRAAWSRPYLNYLLCLAALSRYVDGPPRGFFEIGGGFGVLGEIVMSRDAGARYVNLDLPPLLTVSSYYLDALFGGRVAVYDEAIADAGPIECRGSACLPNWRIGDVEGRFDVFVNSFSFQEMEPPVVAHYVAQVAAKDVPYVVSLNSRLGKPKASPDRAIGVIEPVTSSRIIALFERHGYELLGRHGDPLFQGNAELAILRRKGSSSLAATPLAVNPAAASTDYRRRPIDARSTRLRRWAHEWLPPKVLGGLRNVRRRLAPASRRP
jgi:putative sugar O-methyltransferase